jgi:hypothetical protein
MNERFESLMYQAGMTAQGCWDEMDGYQKESVEKFSELIIQDVLNLFGDELISLHYLEQSCCEDAVYLLRSKVMDRFGVKYPHG